MIAAIAMESTMGGSSLEAPRLIQPPSEPMVHVSEKPLTVSRDLKFVNNRILSQLELLNLCDNVLSQEPFVVGHGSFSDVFKGFCRIRNRGSVMVAMKRLRLHVNEVECKMVCVSANLQKLEEG